MKKTITILTSLIMVILMGLNANAQLLLNEQFDYPVGDSISGHGWTGHSGLGTNTILSTTGSLSYPSYPASVGNKATLNMTGQDINRGFATTYYGNSIYVAALVNVTAATGVGDYFLHLMKPGSTSAFASRVYIKKDTTVTPNKIKFGFMKGSSASNLVYTTSTYDFNTTHLLVIKYTINTGTANDNAFLFVNPAISVEGTPTITATDISQPDLDTVSQGIALRQGSSVNAANLSIDEIRVANSWNAAIGFSGTITAPVVTSVAATGITSTTATCGGNVTSDGGAAITERGICYSTSANPTTADTKVTASGTTGAFTANLTNLTANTTYHFRAYAINSSGTSYGADLDFLTASGSVAPVVTTGAVSAITSSTATVAGEVTNDGGAAITERGICWSTSANPTIADMKVSVAGTTGTFSGNLTSLTGSTLYHVRAYATNSVGTSYGTDVTFTTAVAAIQVASIAELRAKPADNSTLYQLSNEVILTCKITNRNQKYIQDASAAILIDDPNPAKITTVYNVGDGITGIKGKLYNYFGLLEFVPVADPGPATSGQNNVTPLVVTAANMLDTAFMKAHQSKLIKMENIAFAATGNFANGKKYKMTQGATSDSLFYTYIYSIDYIGLPIPQGNGSVTGVVNFTFNKYYITARNKADISLMTGINETEANETGIYPNPTFGKFTLNIDNANGGEVKIYSMVGSLILSKEVYKGINDFDLTSYGKGVYFVRFTDKNGKTSTEKLIVR